MDQRAMSKWKTLALDVRALLFGTVVAVSLVGTYQFVQAKIAERAAAKDGSTLLFPPGEQATLAASEAILAAVYIVMACVPVWLLLTKWRLNNWFTSAVLGYAATLVYWIVSNYIPGQSVLALARSGLIWAMIGAVAGTATFWAAGSGKREARSQI